MPEAEEIALAESDETREMGRARQGSMTSLARPNVRRARAAHVLAHTHLRLAYPCAAP